MAFHPLSWLLRLAVLCHLVLLLTGQQHGVKNCSYTCNGVTPKIPLRLLAGYRRREASCGKPEIILTTIKNRTFCADSEEKWVQEVVGYLNRKAEPTPGRRIGSMTAPATKGMDRPPASEPTAAEESSGQEARRAPGTSPEPPRSPTTSLAPDRAPSDGPERTELFNVSAAAAAATTTTTTTTTTATSWQSPRQPTADLRAEEKASEAASTQALPTAPATSHTAPDPGQDLTPESPLGSSSAHTDAVTGPVAPSREPGSSGSGAPTHKDPQRQDIPTTPDTDREATRRQAVGLLAFLGLLFCLGVALFTYQRLQGCTHSAVGDMVAGLRYVPRSCGSNSYVLVPV
ncbi:fractalkine [Eptesicus fuscus]|uniref:fractalkine n=1 Tax=Eptesicus fuscus TaxID=29078 RepID=UPI0024045E05|nr:fractalkine [Eptesicus fuscus]